MEEKRNNSTKFKDSNFIKGISTVLGSILINFLIGEIFSLPTLIIYELSYLKKTNDAISVDHLTFFILLNYLLNAFSHL